MSKTTQQPIVFMVGKDERLAYLLTRFAEQSGYRLIQHPYHPWIGEIRRTRPSAIIFTSLEQLQAAQALIEDVSGLDIPILACVALADEARARECGADACLVHPLTYEHFRSALTALRPVERDESGSGTKLSGF
ncbi:MAG: hypothetical protein DDG60_13925 [Anaerolineae bacterium]|nr:MAG: hypothetical protein DDG60_13925 [Anaerolineae bacterium]